MSRPSWQLRDAALGYASHGIPVLPLHYPLPHHRDLQTLSEDQRQPRPTVRTSCSCRDPGCGQVAKHPLGSLVPHGVKDATCNRARILAWWTRHPQANIGLATGHLFDILDVDGPQGEQTIRTLAAEHGLTSSGPLVHTGGGGWHFYLAPTGLGNVCPAGLAHVDWRGRGGYVVAPPSRHPSGHPYQWAPGRDLDTPPGQVPAVLLERLQPRQRQQPTRPVRLLAEHGLVGPHVLVPVPAAFREAHRTQPIAEACAHEARDPRPRVDGDAVRRLSRIRDERRAGGPHGVTNRCFESRKALAVPAEMRETALALRGEDEQAVRREPICEAIEQRSELALGKVRQE